MFLAYVPYVSLVRWFKPLFRARAQRSEARARYPPAPILSPHIAYRRSLHLSSELQESTDSQEPMYHAKERESSLALRDGSSIIAVSCGRRVFLLVFST